MDETAAVGTAVGVVRALDPAGGTVRYALTAGNAAGVFAIDAATGTLTVAGALDHATTPAYALTVTASTTEGGMAMATVTITVTEFVMDYDADDDGLIEVADLAQLNAIRWDLDGDGVASDAGYATAFPDKPDDMGCPDTGCTGYELTGGLDFDTDGSGAADAADAYWNDGVGWEPLGDNTTAFNTTFEGNGHTLAHLFIARGTTDYVGLFGKTGTGSVVRHVGAAGAGEVGDVVRQFGLAGAALEAAVDAVDGDQAGERFNDGCGDGRTSRGGATGESGIRPAAGCMGRRNGGLARNKSFFQKTLEAARGDFWLGRRRARAGPATGGSGCGAGGRGCGRAMWRGLGGRLGGAARWERKWVGGEGGSSLWPARTPYGGSGWPETAWADFWRVGDEGWGCAGTVGRRWRGWGRGRVEGVGKERIARRRRGEHGVLGSGLRYGVSSVF